MKKIIASFLLLFSISTAFAQDSDTEIKQIQSYIQATSQNEWFDPVNKNGTLANGTLYDLAYYILPDTKTFSIIYTVFDKYTLQKVFYYKENQLIACIIEETDANNANKLLHYADYFYKNGVLINADDENKEFPATEAYLEGMEKLKEFNALSN